MAKFIAESKRQVNLQVRNAIKKLEQWQRQQYAMLDMARLQDDRCHKSIGTSSMNGAKKPAAENKSSVKKSCVSKMKKSSAAVKKPIITKAAVKKAIAAAQIDTKKKTSIKRNADKLPKQGADPPAKRHVNSMPDLSSQSPEKVPVVVACQACPSMPSEYAYSIVQLHSIKMKLIRLILHALFVCLF